jgi:hypothetical protein
MVIYMYLHERSIFSLLIHLCSFPKIKFEFILRIFYAQVSFRNFGASWLCTLFFAARCLFTRTFLQENKNKNLSFLHKHFSTNIMIEINKMQTSSTLT